MAERRGDEPSGLLRPAVLAGVQHRALELAGASQTCRQADALLPTERRQSLARPRPADGRLGVGDRLAVAHEHELGGRFGRRHRPVTVSGGHFVQQSRAADASASRVGAVPGRARLTIRADTDPRDDAIATAASAHGIDLPGPVVVSDVVLLDADLDDTDRERLGAFLADPLLQTATWEEPATRRPRLRDRPAPRRHRRRRRRARARRRPARHRGARRRRRPAHRAAAPGSPPSAVDDLLRRVLANPVIERWAPSTIEPRFSSRRIIGRAWPSRCRCATSTPPGSAR